MSNKTNQDSCNTPNKPKSSRDTLPLPLPPYIQETIKSFIADCIDNVRPECQLGDPDHWDLSPEGYGITHMKTLEHFGDIAIQPFIYSWGLLCKVNLSQPDHYYQWRYCYPTLNEALEDFNNWDATGHPKGNWNVLKGYKVEMRKTGEVKTPLKTLKIAEIEMYNL